MPLVRYLRGPSASGFQTEPPAAPCFIFTRSGGIWRILEKSCHIGVYAARSALCKVISSTIYRCRVENSSTWKCTMH